MVMPCSARSSSSAEQGTISDGDSVTHALTRRGVEEVHRSVYPLESERLAVLQLRSPTCTCDERNGIGIRSRHMGVDVRLVAQFFDQIDLSGDAGSRGNHLELFRPDSDGD